MPERTRSDMSNHYNHTDQQVKFKNYQLNVNKVSTVYANNNNNSVITMVGSNQNQDLGSGQDVVYMAETDILEDLDKLSSLINIQQ